MYLEKIKHKDQRNRGTSFLLHFSARRDDDIAVAAESGDLAAVRGHLRRDRRCLDRLFEAPGTGGHWAALHRAAAFDHPAVVAFLLAKGAAVDLRDSRGPGAQSRRGAAAAGASDAGGAEVRLRCMLQHSSATWRAPSCCWQRRPRWTSRTTTAGGLSRCHNRFQNSFSPATAINSCSSMWHVLMN